MIVRVQHPARPESHVYVPTRYNQEQGAWVPIVGEDTFFFDKSEAIALSVTDLLKSWDKFADQVAVLRALCEHPSFVVEADGIDDQMIRKRAQKLAADALVIEDNLRKLADQPEEGDIVILGDERQHIDETDRPGRRSRGPGPGLGG